MPQAINPGAPTEPGYSLLIAAPQVPDDGAEWQDGVTWQPRGTCEGEHGALALDCLGDTDAMGDGTRAEPRVQLPVVLWASDTCSVHGAASRLAMEDRAGRARGALQETGSFDLADQLWGDSLATGNARLAHSDSDTVTDGPTSVTGALGQGVYALGQCNRGRRGMVHVTSQALVHLAAVGAIYQQGNLWYTPMGHIVVADDGYDGSGPDGAPAGESQWAYFTDMVRYRLGEVILNPPNPDTAEGHAAGMDRATNDFTVYAMRLALIEWDSCCLFAAELDLPVPLVGGAS